MHGDGADEGTAPLAQRLTLRSESGVGTGSACSNERPSLDAEAAVT
jgi:hypothetical protein